jgi:hypothetical protein
MYANAPNTVIQRAMHIHPAQQFYGPQLSTITSQLLVNHARQVETVGVNERHVRNSANTYKRFRSLPPVQLSYRANRKYNCKMSNFVLDVISRFLPGFI